MKIISIIFLFFCINLYADETKLRKIIAESYPNLPIKSIAKTNYNDLYEIFLGDQIVYSDESFSFLIIEGRLVNPMTRVIVSHAPAIFQVTLCVQFVLNYVSTKREIKLTASSGVLIAMLTTMYICL